jgi:hypothetical protein
MKLDIWAKVVIAAMFIYAVLFLVGLDIIVSSPQ